MSNIYYLSANDFAQDGPHLVANLVGITLVMFHSNKCPHCMAFLPEFKRLPGSIIGINFGICGVDDGNRVIVEMSKASSTPINAVPKFILYVDGRPYVEYSGQRSRPAILSFLQEISAKITQSQSFARARRTRQTSNEPMQQAMPQAMPQQALAPPKNFMAPPQRNMEAPPAASANYKISPTSGVKEYETSYGRPYNTTNEADFLEYENAYREARGK